MTEHDTKTIKDLRRALQVYHMDMLILRSILSDLVPDKESRAELFRANQSRLKCGVIDADELVKESLELQKPIFMDLAEKEFCDQEHRS